MGRMDSVSGALACVGRGREGARVVKVGREKKVGARIDLLYKQSKF